MVHYKMQKRWLLPQNEFRTPVFELIDKEIKHKIIFDGRNLIDVYKMVELGYHYESIGRADSNKIN